MKYIRLLFLGALLTCSSCSTENSFEPEEVKLLVSVEGSENSRVNLDGNDFEDGDRFAFFFKESQPTTPTSKYEYSDKDGWSYKDQPTYWDEQEHNVYRSFCAVSPVNEDNTVDSHSFTVKENQTTEINYRKSDLLIARVNTNKRLIPIKFYHALSRVIIKVTGSTNNKNVNGYFDATDFNEMTVSLNDIKLTGIIDYTTTNPTQNDETYDPKIGVTSTGSAESVSMYSIVDNPTVNGTAKTVLSTFYAIIPPQTISNQILLTIKIKVGETYKTYYYKVVSATFERGKATTINLTLDKSKVELSQIEDAIKISPWKGISAEDDNPIVLQ